MDQSKNPSVTIDGVEVKQKNTVKYLGVMLDKHLTFQDEVKNILRKMARGIKTLNAIKNNFPIATRITLMNALVFSHLHYSAVLLSGLSPFLGDSDAETYSNILNVQYDFDCEVRRNHYLSNFD